MGISFGEPEKSIGIFLNGRISYTRKTTIIRDKSIYYPYFRRSILQNLEQSGLSVRKFSISEVRKIATPILDLHNYAEQIATGFDRIYYGVSSDSGPSRQSYCSLPLNSDYFRSSTLTENENLSETSK